MKTLLSIFVFFSFCSVNAQKSQDTLSIYFDFNKSDFSTEQLAKLKTVSDSELLQIISLSAYCDTVGTMNYNKKLAERRMNSVLNQLRLIPKKTYVDGEITAGKMEVYDADKSRRVDIIYNNSEVDKTEGKALLKTQFKEFISGEANAKTIDLSLLFIAGQPVLITQSVPELIELFELMRDNPNVDVYIHGHVCCADDFKLSYDRAVMVHDYLTSKGISKDRLKYSGHSNKKPKIWPEVTDEDRRSNRRVAVVFTKK